MLKNQPRNYLNDIKQRLLLRSLCIKRLKKAILKVIVRKCECKIGVVFTLGLFWVVLLKKASLRDLTKHRLLLEILEVALFAYSDIH